MRLDKRRLRQLAEKLQLAPRKGDTIEALFERCLARASKLADIMRSEEESDEERRDDWPWSND